MKNHYVLALVLTLGLVLGVEGQTTFKNLGFEVGVPVPIPNDPSGRVYAQNAFPHWTASIGTNEQTAVLFNQRSFSASAISILDHRCAFPGYIAGRYTPFLEARAGTPPSIVAAPPDVSLVQTALVPSNARSLRLLGQAGANAVFEIRLAGVRLDLISCPTGSNCLGYVADISGYAGMVLPLELKLLAPQEAGAQATVCLDSIEFSSLVAANVLWLEITRSPDLAVLTVNGTVPGQAYHIFTRELWSDPWVIQQDITGASGQNWTRATVPVGASSSLFFRTGQSTPVIKVGSHGRSAVGRFFLRPSI